MAKAPQGVAKRYSQWGDRLVGGFLRQRGWWVNLKRVHQVWRQCGLQVPIRKPRKKVVTGAILQPLAKHKNDIWSKDFVHDVATAGELFRCLTMKDEMACFCAAIAVARSFSHQQVLMVLKRLLMLYGSSRHVRSDNGPELMAQPLLTFFNDQEITPSRITPGKPWQNGSNESFKGIFRQNA